MISFIHALGQMPHVQVHDLGKQKCGIVTFTLEGHEPQAIQTRLAEQRINVSVSKLSSTRLDMDERGLESVVRASVHYYNTENEIARFCQALDHLAGF
jgi:selenocysteine lyase/cysteine desulfurase